MDTRLTADQAELFDTVRRAVADHGPTTVVDLDDDERRRRLGDAVGSIGVRGLRERLDGVPLASGVEASLVAEALGEGVADVAYLGPLLAGDLASRAGIDSPEASTVALSGDLSRPAESNGTSLTRPAVAIDADGATHALVLVPHERGFGVASVPVGAAVAGTDLTRPVARLGDDLPVLPVGDARLEPVAITAWRALGLAVAAADAVGAMRGAVSLAVDYAGERRQYGAPIGSYQAVQHLLAEAHTLVEGSLSIVRHAAWSVDALEPEGALRAAASAAAYVGRAQRTVGETVIQVHGGIGNTWECMAHVFLRRTIHDDALLGGSESLIGELAGATGATDGLS